MWLLVPPGFGADTNLAKIVVHEAFHDLQYTLLAGRAPGDPAVAPAWLGEGSAEYIAYRAIAEYRLDTLENIRRAWIARVKSSPAPLRALETYAGFAPQNSPYPLSALAIDRLTQTGGEALLVAYFETVGRGASWPDAFRTVFGKSVEAFYDEFETYRRGL